jgi:argininosuccinate lyase
MPQKRNAFLLEHVRAKPAQALGAWAAAASAMAATPFTNSIEVGTEAMASLWPGLEAAAQAVLLTQVLAGGARPDPDRMAARAVDGFTAATAVANRLVRRGMPFRTAHEQVGDAVRRAVEAGSTRLADFGPPGWLADLGLGDLGGAGLAELVVAHGYGGGPGAFAEPHAAAMESWRASCRWLREWRTAVAGADAELAAAVEPLRGRS